MLVAAHDVVVSRRLELASRLGLDETTCSSSVPRGGRVLRADPDAAMPIAMDHAELAAIVFS
jgi:hypothetical protein